MNKKEELFNLVNNMNQENFLRSIAKLEEFSEVTLEPDEENYLIQKIDSLRVW